MTDRHVTDDGAIDLRCGRWQDVLTNVAECDAVICDPPYSARTHDGSDAAVDVSGDGADRQALGYRPFEATDVHEVCWWWMQRARSWCAFFSDDMLAPLYRSEAMKIGRFDFAPLPVLQHRPRLQGDGPAPGVVWLSVSRPCERRFLGWGSLPGWYTSSPERGAAVMGAKPLALMRAIVRDYTKPGDLVVDPFCGGATTAIACAIEGRRCITSECDPETYAKALARVRKGYTVDAFARGGPKASARQGSLIK